MRVRIEKAKDINEATYNTVVEELGEKYKKIKGMTLDEVAEVVKEPAIPTVPIGNVMVGDPVRAALIVRLL